MTKQYEYYRKTKYEIACPTCEGSGKIYERRLNDRDEEEEEIEELRRLHPNLEHLHEKSVTE